MDEPGLALDIADRLINSAAGLTTGAVISFLWLVKGEALAKMGRLEEARALLVDGRDQAQEAQESFLLWRFHAALGRLQLATGHETAAAEEWLAVRTLTEEMAATMADERLAEEFKRRAFALL